MDYYKLTQRAGRYRYAVRDFENGQLTVLDR